MKLKLLIAASTLLSMLFAAGSATACELERSENGIYIGGCSLSEFFDDIDIDLVEDPHTKLLYPNLRISKIDRQIWGPDIEILVEVENSGWSDAPTFEIIGAATILRADSGQQVDTLPFRVQVAGLAARTKSLKYVVTVVPPDPRYAYDVVTMATVDALQKVDEANEGDNDRNWTCRVLGTDTGQQIPGPTNCYTGR